MEYFQQLEDNDGVRWTWHTFPPKPAKDKGAANGAMYLPDMVVPLACVITPLKSKTKTPTIQGVPNKCKQCGAVSNSFCRLDFSGRCWTCPFCRTRNDLTCQPDSITPDFQQGVSTVEYVLPRTASPPPVFIYVIDVATNPGELEGEKNALLQSLTRLPPDSLVGLITLGQHVTVWETGAEGSRCVVFSGAPKEGSYTLEKVQKYLSVQKGRAGQGVEGKVLLPAAEAEIAIQSIMEDLQPDPWPIPQRTRAQRATGAALEIAVGIAELLSGHDGKVNHRGRIMLFLSGPCTRGPGKMVSLSEEETLRSHSDIKDGQAPHLAKGTEFGKGVAARLRKVGFALDLFMISLDQVGLLELSDAVVYTGGYILSSDTFHSPVFKNSMQKMFERLEDRNTNNMFFDVVLEVQTSNETKIAGCIGPCKSLGKVNSCVSTKVEVGEAGTCAWGTAAIDQNTSFAVVFEAEDEAAGQGSGNRLVQFITSFLDCNGVKRLRVTTTCQQIAKSAHKSVINAVFAFDQLTAATVVGRMAAKYMEQSGNTLGPVLRWVDRLLIKFVQKFATYHVGDADSLQLAQQYSLFPQFMYHLRRSEFLQVFNSSVDETVFFRSCLYRETVPQCVVMLQPSLMAYDYGISEGHPVLLDSKSIKFDNILLCDTYFDIIIHHGRTIAEWRDLKYHEQAEYEAFNHQLEAPHRDMNKVLETRFPVPKITICDQYGSQARYLLYKLNPSDTNSQAVGSDTQVIHTDDANLQTFMVKLKKLACAQES